MGGNAVVIGASIAGLLAARVLADHFESVTLVERDKVASAIGPRKGVAQSGHIHVLWSGGMDAIENLFPGLADELLANGGVRYDNSLDMRWFHHGVWKLRTPSGLRIHSQSRPLLEHCIRERVVALDQVTLLAGHSFEALRTDAGGQQVTGVQLKDLDHPDNSKEIQADLVVDASGRTATVLRSLERTGFENPEVDTIGIDIGYATRIYKQPKNRDIDWQSMVIYPKAPGTYLWGVVFPIEEDQWIVTLVGVHGHHLKTDDPDEFLAFARMLDQPDLYHAIKEAEPVSTVRRIRFAGPQRRRVEKLTSLPGGLIAIGDAICSLNPLYGQGMTVCAREAMVLDRCLQAMPQTYHRGFGQRYFRQAAKVVDTAWLLGTSTDYLYPEADGERSFLQPVVSWYVTRLLNLSGSSPVVLIRFLQVLHFVKPVWSLVLPDIMIRVLFK